MNKQLQPKFTEIMIRKEADRFIVRFWFNSEAVAYALLEHEAGLWFALYANEGWDLQHLLKSIRYYFADAEGAPKLGLAACEVLEKPSLNGVVLYFEWP